MSGYLTSTRTTALALAIAVTASAGIESHGAETPRLDSVLDWSPLPALSEPHALSGVMIGVSGDHLIVAGGAHILGDHQPTGPPIATYSDRLFILADPTAKWSQLQLKLPHPMGYGVSLNWKDSLICLGGGNNQQHFADAFALHLEDGNLSMTRLPPLPRTTKYACGALLDDTIYLAGGLESPEAVESMKTFWSLDLSQPDADRRWQILEPWPGPARMLAVAGVQDEAFFIFGGIHLALDKDYQSRQEVLHDAFRYSPSKGWKRCTDLPRPLAAAPSPAIGLGQSHLVLLEWDDASSLTYHTITDTWVESDEMPIKGGDEAIPLDDSSIHDEPESRPTDSPAATTTTWWRGKIVVPLGTVRHRETGSQVLCAEPQRRKAGLVLLDYLVIAAYFGGLIAMGVYFSGLEKTTDDFFLGGKRVPWWAAGISIFGTVLSPISFMAIPAMIYRTDWVFMPGVLIAIAVAPAVIRFYLPFYRGLNVTTAYEYLEKRFDYVSRAVGSAVFMVFHLVRMGVVLYLPALALAAVTGMNVYACILLLGVISTFYTVMGGIEAVIWTDVLQVLVLISGVAYCLLIIITSVPGGLPGVLSLAYDEGKLHTIEWTGGLTTTVIWVVVGGRFINYLVPFSSDQSIIQRYLTTPDEKQAARAIWTNALMTIPAVVLFFGSGTALWTFYRLQPELLNPVAQTDEIFPWFIATELPYGLSGLVFAALFAACMSSLDSSINSVATAMITDFYRRFRPQVEDDRRLMVARWLTVLIGTAGTAAALLIAWLESPSIWEENLKILGLFMGGLGGLFAAGIFTRRTSGPAVIIGFVASVALTWWVARGEYVHFFLYVVVGFFSCPIIGWLVSWFLPKHRKDLTGLTVHSQRARQ